MSEDSSSKQEPDLAAIEARLEKITPGPWEYDETGSDPLFVKGNPDAMLVWPDFDFSRENISVKMENADGEFIAHAPTDIAALLARARQQDARIAELEVEMDRVKDIAAGVHMANKLLEFDKAGLTEEVGRLRKISQAVGQPEYTNQEWDDNDPFK
jgi:hypothetical protein